MQLIANVNNLLPETIMVHFFLLIRLIGANFNLNISFSMLFIKLTIGTILELLIVTTQHLFDIFYR